MNCLQCLATRDADSAQPVIGACAYCGVNVCASHAEFVVIPTLPIGLVARSRTGARRLECNVCAQSPNGVKFGHNAAALNDEWLERYKHGIMAR
ncbi:MAG: hypothetical protein J2P19_28250 [Pseudonocardia sp.]|nr:hypothetical protein [Pseudonocardia sp.]